MQKIGIISGIFFVLFVLFMVGVTQWEEHEFARTQTTVSVQEGTVEITNNHDPNDQRILHVQPGDFGVGNWADENNVFNAIMSATDIQSGLSAKESLTSASQEEYWITGYIRTVDGQPLPDSQVNVYSADGMPEDDYLSRKEGITGTAQANQEGYYAVHLTKPHPYQITSIPPKDYMTVIQRVALSIQEPTAVVNFSHADAKSKVRGKVIDKETKQPIAKARVAIITQEAPKDPRQIIEHATTSDDGTFLIHRLTNGKYRLEANADGYVDFRPYGKTSSEANPLCDFYVDETTAAKEFVIEMDPGMAATFHVVNAQKEPVENATLKIIRDSDFFFYVGMCTTDAQGSVTNKKLPMEKLMAVATHDDYGSGYSEVFEPSPKESPKQVEIVLTESASVSGNVTDAKGTAKEGRRILAQYKSSQGWSHYPDKETESDSTGRYSFQNLVPGSYEVFMSDRSYPPRPQQPQTVELKAGEHKTDVNFTIGETQELKGQVVEENTKRPVEGVHVFVVVRKEGQVLGTANGNTNANGEFKVTEAPAGGDTIEFQLQDKKGYAHTILDRKPGEDYYVLPITKSGTIQGVVVDTSNQPIAGAEVYPVRLYGGMTTPMIYEKKETGADGSFSFENQDPMDYLIRAKAEGYTQTDSERISLEQGSSVTSVVIQLEKGMEISGVVVDPQGQPVPGANISILSYIPTSSNRNYTSNFMPKNDFPVSAQSDSSGKFLINDFPFKGDTLVICKDPFAPTLFPVTPAMFEQQPYTIRLGHGGVITGTVYDSDGKILAGLALNTQNSSNNLFQFSTQTDPEGVYRFENLTPDSYKVQCMSPDKQNGKMQFKMVEVHDGMETQCDFGGGEGITVHGTIFKHGQPFPGAVVALDARDQDQISTYLAQETNAEGAFSFSGLPEGDYTVFAVSKNPGHVPLYANSSAEYTSRITLSNSQPDYLFNIYMAIVDIQGVVVDDETNEPLAQVSINPRSRSGERLIPYPSLTGVSGADGRFSLSPQDSGEYTFYATLEGYAVQDFQVSVPAVTPGQAAAPVPVEVRMKKDSTNVVVHLFYHGQPAATSWILAYIRTSEYSQRVPQIALPEPGTYNLYGMPEGSGDLTITGYYLAKVMETLSQTITLTKGETTQLALELFEAAHYALQLHPPQDVAITARTTVQLLDMPEVPPIQNKVRNIPKRDIHNVVPLIIPTGSHRIRLMVEGFQPVELTLESSTAFSSSTPDEKTVDVNIVPM